MQTDYDDASSLEVWRPTSQIQSVRLAVCFGDIEVRRSERTDQMHLLVRFPRELPRGQTVGQFMQTFQWTEPRGEIFLKTAERHRAKVTLELPKQVCVETDLGKGELHIASFEGNVQARVAKGHITVDHDFRSLYRFAQASIASGGVRLSEGENRSETIKRFGWRHEGLGSSVLEVELGEGFLDLKAGGTEHQ